MGGATASAARSRGEENELGYSGAGAVVSLGGVESAKRRSLCASTAIVDRAGTVSALQQEPMADAAAVGAVSVSQGWPSGQQSAPCGAMKAHAPAVGITPHNPSSKTLKIA